MFQLEIPSNTHLRWVTSSCLLFCLSTLIKRRDFHVHLLLRELQVRRKGYWTLFVEFPGDRYAKSPRKVRFLIFMTSIGLFQIISRDSYRKWVMEVYYYPGAVGFSEWHKLGRKNQRHVHHG